MSFVTRRESRSRSKKRLKVINQCLGQEVTTHSRFGKPLVRSYSTPELVRHLICWLINDTFSTNESFLYIPCNIVLCAVTYCRRKSHFLRVSFSTVIRVREGASCLTLPNVSRISRALEQTWTPSFLETATSTAHSFRLHCVKKPRTILGDKKW